MRNFCFEDATSVLRELKTDGDGLSDKEASERLKIYGKNILEEGGNTSVFRLFFSQFSDFMTLLLIAAAFVSGIIAFLSGDNGDLTDTVIILAIIFLNAAVGTVQQYRADKAIKSLQALSSDSCKVRRGGREKTVPCAEVTVGDIVLLSEGDVIPADCRITECNNLFCDESALTGESLPAEKNAERIRKDRVALGSMTNTLFGSTFVVRGNCVAVVTDVGMGTEMGRIAAMLKDSKPDKTPLEKSLSRLGKIISAFVLAVTVLIFTVGVFLRPYGILKNFMTAVAIAVAAIPEGLPAVVTIIMAMGVQKMSRKNVIIRKLKSVETLGSCSVICSDKTGTLTENKMRVTKIWCGDMPDFSARTPKEAQLFPCAEKLVGCMAVCGDVKGVKGEYIGDPTEIALKVCAEENGFSEDFEKLAENPFTSERKMMSVAAKTPRGDFVYAKGAPDILLEKCTHIFKNFKAEELTEDEKRRIYALNDGLSDSALRVLACAFAPYDGKISEERLVFLGLVGMEDGLKDGAAEAAEECREAGITTVMITGDHVRTAFAVARKLKIVSDMSEVMTGEELDGLSGAERDEAVARCRVFARVSPKHKNIIVRSFKKQGKIVAMTGDGINDAPSIKSADIGVAMGGGTDVTKNAADMVITDNNFATIVSAVREGRRISANIRKTIEFFLSTNLAEVLAVLIASLFLFRYDFLLSTQLLWLNLITDSFPVLALGAEREEEGIMRRPPERAEEALFSRRSLFEILFSGAYMTAVTVVVFCVFLRLYGNAAATTATFLTISFLELFHAFNVRAEYGSAFRGFFGNKILVATVAAGIAVNVVLCATPLSAAFSLVPLDGVQWLAVFASAFSVIPVHEIFKASARLLRRGERKSGLSPMRPRRVGKTPRKSCR